MDLFSSAALAEAAAFASLCLRNGVFVFFNKGRLPLSCMAFQKAALSKK
jgi:hypothetical protein